MGRAGWSEGRETPTCWLYVLEWILVSAMVIINHDLIKLSTTKTQIPLFLLSKHISVLWKLLQKFGVCSGIEHLFGPCLLLYNDYWASYPLRGHWRFDFALRNKNLVCLSWVLPSVGNKTLCPWFADYT